MIPMGVTQGFPAICFLNNFPQYGKELRPGIHSSGFVIPKKGCDWLKIQLNESIPHLNKNESQMFHACFVLIPTFTMN